MCCWCTDAQDVQDVHALRLQLQVYSLRCIMQSRTTVLWHTALLRVHSLQIYVQAELCPLWFDRHPTCTVKWDHQCMPSVCSLSFSK